MKTQRKIISSIIELLNDPNVRIDLTYKNGEAILRISENNEEFQLSGSDVPNKDTKYQITKLLKSMGVRVNLAGFGYIIDAVSMEIDNGLRRCSMTKEVYPKIAKMNESTPSRVERAIRHSIETAWGQESNEKAFQEVFGCKSITKPTNSEFIFTLVDYIQMHNS